MVEPGHHLSFTSLKDLFMLLGAIIGNHAPNACISKSWNTKFWNIAISFSSFLYGFGLWASHFCFMPPSCSWVIFRLCLDYWSGFLSVVLLLMSLQKTFPTYLFLLPSLSTFLILWNPHPRVSARSLMPPSTNIHSLLLNLCLLPCSLFSVFHMIFSLFVPMIYKGCALCKIFFLVSGFQTIFLLAQKAFSKLSSWKFFIIKDFFLWIQGVCFLGFFGLFVGGVDRTCDMQLFPGQWSTLSHSIDNAKPLTTRPPGNSDKIWLLIWLWF